MTVRSSGRLKATRPDETPIAPYSSTTRWMGYRARGRVCHTLKRPIGQGLRARCRSGRDEIDQARERVDLLAALLQHRCTVWRSVRPAERTQSRELGLGATGPTVRRRVEANAGPARAASGALAGRPASRAGSVLQTSDRGRDHHCPRPPPQHRESQPSTGLRCTTCQITRGAIQQAMVISRSCQFRRGTRHPRRAVRSTSTVKPTAATCAIQPHLLQESGRVPRMQRQVQQVELWVRDRVPQQGLVPEQRNGDGDARQRLRQQVRRAGRASGDRSAAPPCIHAASFDGIEEQRDNRDGRTGRQHEIKGRREQRPQQGRCIGGPREDRRVRPISGCGRKKREPCRGDTQHDQSDGASVAGAVREVPPIEQWPREQQQVSATTTSDNDHVDAASALAC